MMTLVKSTPLPNGPSIKLSPHQLARGRVPESKLPAYDAHGANGNLHANGGRAFKHVEREAISIGNHEAAANFKQGRKVAGKLAAIGFSKARKLATPVDAAA